MRLMMPRTSVLMAVHRHTAASRSTSPASSGQHWLPFVAFLPPCLGRTTPGSPLSRLAHTLSFSGLQELPFPVDGGGGGALGTAGGGGGGGGTWAAAKESAVIWARSTASLDDGVIATQAC